MKDVHRLRHESLVLSSSLLVSFARDIPLVVLSSWIRRLFAEREEESESEVVTTLVPPLDLLLALIAPREEVFLPNDVEIFASVKSHDFIMAPPTFGG
jgi:hypothetical protein